jgi:hypothetical protein
MTSALPTRGQGPLSLHAHLPERSSPSRVRFAAQTTRALDRSGPFRNLILRQGKGGQCKALSLDRVNKVEASLQVPASLASTAYSDRRNALFTSSESALKNSRSLKSPESFPKFSEGKSLTFLWKSRRLRGC